MFRRCVIFGNSSLVRARAILSAHRQEARGYDAADRLTGVVANDALGSVQTAYSYVLDAVGNRKQMIDFQGNVTSYKFNSRNELTSETPGATIAWLTFTLAEWLAFTLDEWDAFLLASPPSGPSTTHAYDAVGNRKTVTDSSGTTTYTYDAANQLHTSVDPMGVHTTYTYDGAGNLVSKNVGGTVTTHVYNGPNRLVGVQSPTAGDATFVYDPDGRRVQKESTSENTRFIWDAERLLRETDTAGETTVDYTQSATGSGEGGFGNLVSEYQYDSSTSYQHAFDALGSTGALLDSSGSAVDRWQYSAFGLQQSAPEDPPTRLSYASQKGYQFDLELDLYYCRNRYYDPSLGRWLNQDPAEADQLNTYRYVKNNPVNKTDPSGLQIPIIDPEVDAYYEALDRARTLIKQIDQQNSAIEYMRGQLVSAYNNRGLCIMQIAFGRSPASVRAAMRACSSNWFNCSGPSQRKIRSMPR